MSDEKKRKDEQEFSTTFQDITIKAEEKARRLGITTFELWHEETRRENIKNRLQKAIDDKEERIAKLCILKKMIDRLTLQEFECFKTLFNECEL